MIDLTVELFWNKHKKKIFPWYLEQRQKDDVIISASPYFLLKPICDELDVNVVASNVNKFDGHFYGKNCYAEEKVIRFQDEYGKLAQIDAFYSDSKSDISLAHIAKEAYLCYKGERKRWM